MDLANRMIKCVENNEVKLNNIKIRIGIHTGPVFAGVIGKWKYCFDIWGDTVNIANRIESNGEIGVINISEETYNSLLDKKIIKQTIKKDLKGYGSKNIITI